MKKNHFILTICIVATIFTSCSKEDILPSKDLSIIGNVDNNIIGKIHNESLREIMDFVNSNKSTFSAKNQDILISETKKSYKKFILSKVETDWDNSEIELFWSKFDKYEYRNTKEYSQIINSIYYQKLMDIIDSGNNIHTVHTEIESLIQDLVNDNSIKKENKVALKSAMLVAKSSFKFWNKNRKEALAIRTVFTEPSLTTYGIDIDNPHLKADIEGAVGGAITGGLTGGLTGGPAGAAIGAMLGAPWSSAVSGFFDQFIWN